MEKIYRFRKNVNHVFFINNNIVYLISMLIINKYNIDPENVLIVSLRNTNTQLILGEEINIKRFYIIEKIIAKLFLFNLFGFLIRKKLESLNNNFILYTPWDLDEVIPVFKSKFCLGHCYLEEGQMSYLNFIEYKSCKTYKKQWLRLKEKKLSLKNLKYNDDTSVFKKIFNDSSIKYFSISENAFPLIEDRKKITLKNFEIIKNSYNPKLIGIKNLGIFCSPRRIKKNGLDKILIRLCDYLPYNSALKLHPEMYVDNSYILEIKLILVRISRSDILLCESNTIIEAEMLFEKKNLFGPLTSLIKYAEIFGSTFTKVNIY